MAAVRLDEWIQAWYKAHPGEKLSPELADQIFVGLCRLFQKEFPSIAASPEAEELMRGLCPACFWMEGDRPVSFTPVTGNVDYCPAEEPADEATCLFGMGLILYELLTGDIYANKFDYQVGMSDYYWSFLREQAALEGRESLADTSALPPEYKDLTEIFSELTQYDREARPASLLAGEIPVCEYEWKATDEASGQIISRKSGLIKGIDAVEKLPSVLEINDRYYEAVEGQETEISYSFLKKTYQIRYRESAVRGAVSAGDAAHGAVSVGDAAYGAATAGDAAYGAASAGDAAHGAAFAGVAAHGSNSAGDAAHGTASAGDAAYGTASAGSTAGKIAGGSASWEDGDLGLLVSDGAGGRCFAPLILREEPDVRYRMRPECPIGYSSWRAVPSLLLTVMRRKKGCGAITRIEERPDVFRKERCFMLELNDPDRGTAYSELNYPDRDAAYLELNDPDRGAACSELNDPGGGAAYPELELVENEDGGFKIRCEWVSADGRKMGTSEAGD